MKRRDVLKGLAGAAALCALPRNGMAATRPAMAGRIGLMLDGTFAGYLQSASGGLARGDVVLERLAGSVTRKHLGAPVYEDIVIEFSTGMAKSVYDWMAATLAGKVTRKNGAIVSLDMNNAVQSSLEFSSALLSEIGVPAADASAKDPLRFQLKITPELTRNKKSDGSKVTPGKIDKAVLGSSFRFTLSGLDTVSSRVSKVDAFAIKQKFSSDAIGEKRIATKEPSQLEVPNLLVTVGENAAAELFDWHEDFVIKGNNGQDKEKTATLEFLMPDLKTALLTFQFSGVGIFRLESSTEANADAIRKIRASLYCEEIRLDSKLGT